MIVNITIFLSGLLFALGLGISGMTQPQKVTGFLNVLGDWDPSLALVMAGGVSVYLLLHRLILKRSRPIFGRSFFLPTHQDIDRPLLLGAALFGLGWGLVGFCPGPALVSTVTGHPAVLIFVLAMAAGMYAFEVLDVRKFFRGKMLWQEE
ncbi:MAG: DUF6691 family protein [Candidatus Binatia bacterium]